MAERLARAVIEIVVDDKQYKFALGEVEKKSDRTAESIRGIGQAVDLAVFREFGRIAVHAIGAVLGKVVELGQRGAAIDDVATSFNALTGAAGETADVMLGKMREGVKGTLTDFELMTLANKPLGAGLVKTAEDMGVLAAGARALAKATGGETKEAFETLTTAMASGRTATLKQLGLFVDSKQAIEDYARAHNKSVSAMNDAERAAALAAASLTALRDRMREIPPDAADFGELIEAARAKLGNFVDGLAVGISRSPVFRAGMLAAGEAIDRAFGGDQQATIDAVVRTIEGLIIQAVGVTRVLVEGAGLVANAWNGVKFLFDAVLATVSAQFTVIVSGIASVLGAASLIPVVGEKFRGAAADARGFADQLTAVALSFGDQANEALDSAATTTAAVEAIDGVLASMQASMLAAQGASRGLGASVQTSMAQLGEGAETGARRSDEAAKKIADTIAKLNEEIALSTKTGADKRLMELEFAQARELQLAAELKEKTPAEYQQMVGLILEKYRLLRAGVALGGDELKQKETDLQQQLSLLQSSGLQTRLLELELARQRELATLEPLKLGYAAMYAELVALTNEKYNEMSRQAQGHFATVAQAAAAAGFKTRAELQATANRSMQLYRDMLASGLFTEAQLLEAKKKAEEDKRAATGDTKTYTLKSSEAIVQGSIEIFGVLGRKFKAAAIAGAIISTYQAVAKALASAPWPANLVLAAGALAAGMSNVARIRSADEGWAMGTPGLDFAGFGTQSLQLLHGNEAVIPQGSGHLLAGEIADALNSREDMGGALERIAAGIDALPNTLRRAVRDGMLVAN